MTDLEKMKEAELLSLKLSIDCRLSEINEAKAEKKRKKQEYTLVGIIPDKIPQYHRMWDAVVSAIESGETLDKARLDAIFDKGCTLAHIDRSKVYPCPNCESKGTLYAGDFGRTYNPKHKITCSSCDFTAQVKAEESQYDAWQSFHKWLIRNGYLNETVEFNW